MTGIARALGLTRVSSCVMARAQGVKRLGLSVSVAAATMHCRSKASRASFVVKAARKEIISTDAAPGAVGPYSQAIKSGGFLYVSGCIPLVPGVSISFHSIHGNVLVDL